MIILNLLFILFTMITCGMGNRLRGGLWGDQIGWGATTARIIAWAIPMALWSLFWYGLIWYQVILMGVAAWLGTIAGWWGQCIDMGRRDGTWIHDMCWITLRGSVWTLPVALVLMWAGFVPAAIVVQLSGTLMGVWYELGWRCASHMPGFNQGPEVGELLFGVMFGLALAVGSLL